MALNAQVDSPHHHHHACSTSSLTHQILVDPLQRRSRWIAVWPKRNQSMQTVRDLRLGDRCLRCFRNELRNSAKQDKRERDNGFSHIHRSKRRSDKLRMEVIGIASRCQFDMSQLDGSVKIALHGASLHCLVSWRYDCAGHPPLRSKLASKALDLSSGSAEPKQLPSGSSTGSERSRASLSGLYPA